jgi:hypothetical protein
MRFKVALQRSRASFAATLWSARLVVGSLIRDRPLVNLLGLSPSGAEQVEQDHPV